jgi:NTP pyrophosphatase (non-canonical NTP hydrolase)
MMKPLTFNGYQAAARSTAIYPKEIGLAYTALGFAGEAGEVADKIKKVYRDCGGVLDNTARAVITKEVGDVLWYAANLLDELGVTMEDCALGNLEKLAGRAARGTLQGSGDDR